MHDLVWLATYEPNQNASFEEKSENDEFRKDCFEWVVTAFRFAYIWPHLHNQEEYDDWLRDLREFFFGPNYLPGKPARAEVDPESTVGLANTRILSRPN
jgi:hypothetical protein